MQFILLSSITLLFAFLLWFKVNQNLPLRHQLQWRRLALLNSLFTLALAHWLQIDRVGDLFAAALFCLLTSLGGLLLLLPLALFINYFRRCNPIQERL